MMTDIEARDLRLKYISDIMDGFNDYESEFIFWYLMPQIIEKIKVWSQIKPNGTATDMAASLMANDMRISMEHLRDILTYDLF